MIYSSSINPINNIFISVDNLSLQNIDLTNKTITIRDLKIFDRVSNGDRVVSIQDEKNIVAILQSP